MKKKTVECVFRNLRIFPMAIFGKKMQENGSNLIEIGI